MDILKLLKKIGIILIMLFLILIIAFNIISGLQTIPDLKNDAGFALGMLMGNVAIALVCIWACKKLYRLEFQKKK